MLSKQKNTHRGLTKNQIKIIGVPAGLCETNPNFCYLRGWTENEDFLVNTKLTYKVLASSLRKI